MTDERQKLEEHLHAAQDLHERHTRAVREILELLAKADARRKAEPDNQRRWNQVLDQLETSLTQARARVSASEHELSVARRELQEALGAAALRVAEESHESVENGAEGNSFESRLEKVIGVENAAAALNDGKLASPDQEPAGAHASPGQQVLQSAIDKIQQHRVHALSGEEVKATIAAYERLSKTPSPNLKDQRLMRILGAAVKIFRRTARRKKQ